MQAAKSPEFRDFKSIIGISWDGIGGGDGGIRTHDTGLPYTHFPGVRLRPLGHVSGSLFQAGARPLACSPLQCKARDGTKAVMKNFALGALAAFALASPSFAQDEDASKPALGPHDIVNAAPQEDWVVIAPEDMLVMTLAHDRDGNPRQVVMQLMPVPFSQGWVENIRTLARAKWYDGISVNRVQDNYVVQWGDPGHDNPEGDGIETKPLPEGLNVMGEEDYATKITDDFIEAVKQFTQRQFQQSGNGWTVYAPLASNPKDAFGPEFLKESIGDNYAEYALNYRGWPTAIGKRDEGIWPIHCYGMVGVGRNHSPDTGSGAELYTVIGHAPRHLDRNIALVGRIIGGMEHLSSLPRGSGALGFYTAEEADKRVPILSIRVASDLPEEERPLYEYLNTETETFARYAEARANRRDPFFIVPAGGADICNIPVPVRAFEYND